MKIKQGFLKGFQLQIPSIHQILIRNIKRSKQRNILLIEVTFFRLMYSKCYTQWFLSIVRLSTSPKPLSVDSTKFSSKAFKWANSLKYLISLQFSLFNVNYHICYNQNNVSQQQSALRAIEGHNTL